VGGLEATVVVRAKRWFRPLVRRGRSRGPIRKARVLLWLESEREVILGSLLPVRDELERLGCDAAVVAHGVRAGMAGGAVEFAFPARAIPPAWADKAWNSLRDALDWKPRPGTKELFLGECTFATEIADEMSRLLDMIRPAVTVGAATNLPGGAALAVLSRGRGIESFVLQHGITQVFYTPLLADRMVTWGRSSVDDMAVLGVPRDRLLPLGSPRHDRMVAAPSGDARERLCRALGVPDRPTFVFFSNGNDLVRNGDAPCVCAGWLAEAGERLGGRWNMVVRLHPNEQGSLYSGLRGLCISRTAEVDLETVLAGCDVAGSLCSSALYEALLFDKPVLHFDRDDFPPLAENWQRGLAVRVSSAADLETRLGALASGRKSGVGHGAGVGLGSEVFANHGAAARTIAAHLMERAGLG